MKILVTGGAGFIGSHVADALLEAGHDVVVLDDLSSGRRENVPARARFVELDLRDGDALHALLDEARFDAISHQAAQTSVAVSTREPVRDAEVNVLGTIHLLEAAVRTGVGHVVFASTGGAIYGEVPPPQRASIDTPQRPLSPYACSKLAGEAYLRRYAHDFGLRTTVLRYANVYGPRQDPHGEAGVVAIFTERLLRGEPIRINARREPGDAGCIRDYVYVGDVVAANVRAIEGKIAAPVVHCATGVETSTLELARKIEASAGVQATMTFGPKREGDVERSVLEPSEDATGGALTPLEEGIRRTVAWFRARALA